MARKPVQERSRARAERVLAETRSLLASKSFEDLTVRDIAEAADVPVGSIYQFFDGKTGIYDALSEKFAGEVADFSNTHMTPEALARDPEAFIGNMVDGLENLQDQNEGFICIARTPSGAGVAGFLADNLRRDLTARLDLVVKQAMPGLTPARRGIFIAVLGSTMTDAFAKVPPKTSRTRKPYIAEIKRMLTAYARDTLKTQ